MPVVINEFEVLDTPPGEGTRTQDAAPAKAPQRPDPEDLRRLLDVLSEAQLRLWAH